MIGVQKLKHAKVKLLFPDVAKQANLSTPTLWLGRLVKLTRTGAYEWNDGSVGRHADGFRGGELFQLLSIDTLMQIIYSLSFLVCLKR